MLDDREIREFWNRTTVTKGCWPWMGAALPTGYGFFTRYTMDGNVRKRATVYAHRFSYELHHGEIPKGMLVMHTCDTPGCVNPGHLKLGTPQDNVDDMADKQRHPDIMRQPVVKRVVDIEDVIFRHFVIEPFTPKTLGKHVPVYFRLRHGGKRPS